MDKNKKIIKTGLILIGVTLLLCICANLFLRIKKPVFLEHYYEYTMHLQNEQNLYYSVGFGFPIRIQYITNVSDDKRVIGISFKEAPYLTVNASEYEPTNSFSGMFQFHSKDDVLGTKIGTYCLRSIYLTINVPINSATDQLELSEAIIYFNNGEQMEVNIGKLVLYKEKLPGRDYLEQTSSSSSNKESNISFKLLDDIKMEAIDSPLFDKLDHYINIKINREEYPGVSCNEYKKGDTVLISSTLNPDVTSDFIRIGIYPRIYYQNSKGNTYFEPLFLIENEYYINPDFLDVIKYVKLKR